MSCCGAKRQAWREQNQRAVTNAETGHDQHVPSSMANASPKIFEYTGPHSLNLTGAASGKLYHFRHTGAQVSVDPLDAFAMLAERDLKIVRVELNLSK
jgi:hypothetical protein